MEQGKRIKLSALHLSAKSMVSTLLLLFAMLMPQGAWAISGSGTSSSPYLIANEADLRTFQQYVENGNSGIYGKLTADITLTSAWTRIGRADRKFTGYFDGQGHTISGMNLSFTAYEHGFFGFVNNATIKNFTLTGTMTSSANGNHSHGTVVGSAAGTTVIENVTSSINLTINHTGFTCIGGIVGHMADNTRVTGCTYNGTINLNKNSEQVGGIVGYAQNDLYITNNVFSGTITSTGTCKYLAGIAGKTDGTIEVSGCTNIGTINGGPSYDCVAGIVGYVQYQSRALITNCYFGGSLSSTSSGTSLVMGGILGAVNDEKGGNFRGLTYCFSDGTLTATSSSSTQIGGIAGVVKHKAVSMVTNNTYLSGKASRISAIDGSLSFDSSNKAITISVTAGTGGTVKKSYVYPTSTTATQLQVVATPNSGYHYVKWSDNEAQTHNVSLANNVSLTATFGAHSWQNTGVKISDVTCETAEVYYQKCSVCGRTNDANHTYTMAPALGHNYNANGVCTHDASHFQEPTLSGGYYQIANYGNLCWFRDKVNGGSYTINAKQTADITMPNGVTWGGIGHIDNSSNGFKGTYDGNSHTISGIKISQDLTAFINTTYNATIKNLGLLNVSVSGVGTAGLVRLADKSTTISNCYVRGSAAYPFCRTNSRYSTIINCFASVTGGTSLVSGNSGTIQNCYTNLNKIYFDYSGTEINCKTSVSASTFASGEITYLLNSGVTNGTQVWYQKLGNGGNALPTLVKNTSNTVYKRENLKCDGVTKNGSVTYGNSSQPNVDAHNWTNTTTYSLSAADCTHDAVYYKACSVCNVKGSETWTATGTALGHDYSQVVDANYLVYPATCDADAVYHEKCSRCTTHGAEWSATGTALNHDYHQVVDADYRVSAATCTADAKYQEKCSRCDTHGAEWTDEGTMLSHIMTEHAAHDATCTKAGNKLYYTCSQSCCSGKYYKDNLAHTTNRYATWAGAVITAPGHTYVDGHCSVCGGKAPITVTLENGKVKEYDSLLEAINYIVDSRMNGATLTLHQDLTIEGDEDIDIWFSAPGYDFNFTIDLNGHTITGSCEYEPNYIDIKNFQSGLTTVTIDNSCQDKIGKLFNCCLEIKAFTKVIVNEGVSIYPKFENLFKEFIVYIDTETSSLVNYGDIYGDVMVCPGGKFINNGRVVSVSGNYEENGDYCAYFNWADDGSSFSVYDGVVHYSNEKDASITSEVTKEPTCSEPGVRTFTGTYGEFTDTKEVEIPATGLHTFDDVTDPHHTLCTVCDHSFFRYTSSTEDVVNPKNADELKDAYDAKLDFTNTYVDGQGVMEFKGTLKTIGENAFDGCKGFTGNLIIPNSVTSIGYEAFYGCKGFTGNLIIPNSVTSIGDNAFPECSGFTGNLTIPNSVTSIGDLAFYGCKGFTGNLTIPNSVTSIGKSAFLGCSGFNGNLTIPNSVTSIGDNAFYECKGLKGNLTIPNSVTSIGSNAFKSCSSFTGIELNSVPIAGINIFTNVNCPKTVVLSDDSYVYTGRNPNFPALQSATYTRRGIKNQWGTIVVPFDVENGDEYDFYTLSSLSGDELTLTKVNGRLAAGTPALIRINSELVDGKTYDLTLRAVSHVVDAQGTLTGTPADGLTLTGSYEVNDITENNGYIISSNKFWSIQEVKGSNNVYCAPFRAYLSSSSPVGAKQLNIGQGKEATAIEAITAITEGEAEYYDINGHRINSLQKGVNIIRYSNGKTKKVVIK